MKNEVEQKNNPTFTPTQVFDLYVIEWSEIQEAFHTDKLSDVLVNNLQAYLQGEDSQYYPILLAESSDEANELIENLRSERDKNPALKIRTPRIIELLTRIKQLNTELAEIDAELRQLRAEK